jgi:hypothetical protein
MSNLQKQNNTVTKWTNFLWHPFNHKIQKPLHSVHITKFLTPYFAPPQKLKQKGTIVSTVKLAESEGKCWLHRPVLKVNRITQ